MDDQGQEPVLAAIAADVGANLSAILVILIAAATLLAPSGPAERSETLHPSLTAIPLSGREQSDLLYQRLRPGSGILPVELTANGAFVPSEGGMVPLADHPEPWPTDVALFVFSAVHHATIRNLADGRGLAVKEITVPQVLRRPTPRPGESAFSASFLAIRPGPDPASIRPPLLRLLQSSVSRGGTDEAGSRNTQPRTSVLSVMLGELRTAANLILLLISIGVLMRLRRRWR